MSSDGTIVFDTSIDTSGVKKAKAVIYNAFDSINPKINKIESTARGAANKIVATIQKSGSLIKSQTQKIGSAFTNLKFTISSLLKTVSLLMILRQALNFGKEAVSSASALEEAQNVVETAFGGMIDKAEQFAKSAKKVWACPSLQPNNILQHML